MAGSATYNSGKELEIQIQSGSKLMPLYPMRSLSESYTQLRKCMGIHHSNFHSIDIDMSEYRTHLLQPLTAKLFWVHLFQVLILRWKFINC